MVIIGTKQVLPEAYDAGIDDSAGYCYAYDRTGHMTQIQDPDGNVLHIYTYNEAGQTIRETDGEGQETLYAYNGLGQLTRAQTSIRREGDTTYYRVTVYTYDRTGNKIEKAYGQQEVEKDKNPDSWHRIHFSYDQNSHLVLVKLQALLMETMKRPPTAQTAGAESQEQASLTV